MLLLEAKVRARAPVQGPQRLFGGSLPSHQHPPRKAISKAREVVDRGKSKGKGTGPGLTEVVLGVALRPPLDPPLARIDSLQTE